MPSDGFELEHVLADIETLNRAAFEGTYEITAVSFHAYAHLTDRYVLLPHGASMGDRYGPVVVARNGRPVVAEGRARRRAGRADDRVSRAAAVRSGRPVRRRCRSTRSRTGARRRGRRRAADSRRPADLRGRGPEEDRRSGRMVGRRTGGLPLPARRQRHPPRSRRRTAIATLSRLLHDSIAYALEHRAEAVEYAMQFGRGLDRENDRRVRRHVRERPDARLRRARARQPCGGCSATRRRPVCCRSRSRSNSPIVGHPVGRSLNQ